MAKSIKIVLTDDYTGKATGQVETYNFVWLDGTEYEIDLARASRKAADQAFAEFLAVARPAAKVRRRTKNTSAPKQTRAQQKSEVREWARSNGHEVGDRGALPREIKQAYAEATGQTLE